MVDGHDVEELCKELWHAERFKGKPTAIVAKTFKGKGLKGDYRVITWENWSFLISTVVLLLMLH